MPLLARPAEGRRTASGGRSAPVDDERMHAVPVVRRVRRGLIVLTAIALLPQAQRLWTAAAAPARTEHAQVIHGTLLLVAVSAFVALLAITMLALGTSARRALHRLDIAVLVVGVLVLIGRFILIHALNDEGALTARAAQALLGGDPVYGADWPGVFLHVPLTKTMGGGGDLQYGYPPLAVLLTAAIAGVLHSTAIAASAVTTGALLIAALVLWRQVEPVWRPVVVIVLLALDPISESATGGSPVIVAIASLLPVVLHIERTGAGGALGRRGVGRAAALGAACAAHQLAWFVVPFIVLTVYAMRAREVGHGAAAMLVGRAVVLATATFGVIDLPFILSDPSAWAHGVLLPLQQHAIVHGQGLVDVPYLLTTGSGALDLFTAASVALLGGLLLAVLLLPGRFGPGFVVAPVAVFLVATRSDFAYWMQFSPLVLAGAATVPLASFRRAWHPGRIGPFVPRTGIVAVLLAPAVVLGLVAAWSPAPLRLRVDIAHASPANRSVITDVRLVADNLSDRPVVPHFATELGGGTSGWWEVLQGPVTLQPGAHAVYLLEPVAEQQRFVPGSKLVAVSDRPMTISSVLLPTVLARP